MSGCLQEDGTSLTSGSVSQILRSNRTLCTSGCGEHQGKLLILFAGTMLVDALQHERVAM